MGTHFLQPLKDIEFLSAIKHRSAIPGGTCEFDLPEFSHWLRQPYARRQQDLAGWLSIVRPICDAVVELLWLIREIAQPTERLAINGMYQHNDAQVRAMPDVAGPAAVRQPVVSGDQRQPPAVYRAFPGMVDRSSVRAVQTTHDVSFRISIC